MIHLLKFFLIIGIFFSTSFSYSHSDFKNEILFKSVFRLDWDYLLNDILPNNKIENYKIYLKKKIRQMDLLDKKYSEVYHERFDQFYTFESDLKAELEMDISLYNSIERLRQKYQTWDEWFAYYWNEYSGPFLVVVGVVFIVTTSYYFFQGVVVAGSTGSDDVDCIIEDTGRNNVNISCNDGIVAY